VTVATEINFQRVFAIFKDRLTRKD
jgi:hypothetical protein